MACAIPQLATPPVAVYIQVKVTSGSSNPNDVDASFLQVDSQQANPVSPGTKSSVSGVTVGQSGNVATNTVPDVFIIYYISGNAWPPAHGSTPAGPAFLFTDNPLEVSNSIANSLHPYHHTDPDFSLASTDNPPAADNLTAEGAGTACFRFKVKSNRPYRVYGLNVTDGINYYVLEPKITNQGPITLDGFLLRK